MSTTAGIFSAGDEVLLIDRKKRRYLLTLEADGQFHSHAGYLAHNDLIGRTEGCRVASTRGAAYLAIRPTLSDFILKMPRGAQVIYPKDLGPILMLADIQPGHRVLESGVGSGATSMTLLRAGADVIGYEIREDFANRARANVETFLGTDVAEQRYHVEIRSAYDGIDAVNLDRAILDLPEPWQVMPHLATALRPGGIVVAYTPSIVQVQRLHESLADLPFGLTETTEILQRSWHVDGMAVRPDHRMVAHTGFLTQTRRIDQPTD